MSKNNTSMILLIFMEDIFLLYMSNNGCFNFIIKIADIYTGALVKQKPQNFQKSQNQLWICVRMFRGGKANWRFFFNRNLKLGFENAEKKMSFARLIIKSIT